MKHLILPLLLILTIQSTIAQFSWNAELNLQGMVSTEKEELPFWMYHNQRGRIDKETNLLSLLNGKAIYDLGDRGLLEAGAGVLVRDTNSDKVFTDELYLNYSKAWFELTLGRKQRKEVYKGLSSSNESILWSLNTRPLPGIQLKTTRPVFLIKNFGFEASWEEYLMDDDRFVDNARLHHKSFHLVYSTAARKFLVKAGIQHFVQWGGTSLIYGKQPTGLDDYLRIFTGRGGNTDAVLGDQLNALGNHIGGYELKILKKFTSFDLELFYNHLFEDGSGSRLGNTPDGRYGIYLKSLKDQLLISSFIYEFYYTKHQSQTTTGEDKTDSYFSHWIYRSGWTYSSDFIGAPFFRPNKNGLGMNNNMFIAHHLGIGGTASVFSKKYPYKLLLSYAHNEGNYYNKFHENVLNALYEIILTQTFLELTLQLGAEYQSNNYTNYGLGIKLKYLL